MHILYLHQYFATPHAQTGTRSYEFARRWVAAGHRVTMITTAANLTSEDYGPVPRKFISRIPIDGIEVIAINIAYRQSMGFLRRLWSFYLFMKIASWFVLIQPDVDVVYASSTPLTIGVPALVGQWFRRRRFVFEVRDPWPAVPIEMGVLKNSFLIFLAKRLERMIYRNASAIITASEGMTELVQRVTSTDKKIITVPNAADTDVFTPEVDGRAVRQQHGWEDRCVCLHAGAMGRVNGLELIVRAAHHFREDPELLFVLVGEGKEKESLIAQCDQLGLKNIQIIDGIAKKEMPAMLAAADICLMTIANIPVLERNSANKFFDYLSAGKPVILNYSGWQRIILESTQAGVGCAIDDANEFFEKIASLKSDSIRRKTMAQNARKLASEQFNRDDLADAALKVVLDCA